MLVKVRAWRSRAPVRDASELANSSPVATASLGYWLARSA
jgi:hypothetical protein